MTYSTHEWKRAADESQTRADRRRATPADPYGLIGLLPQTRRGWLEVAVGVAVLIAAAALLILCVGALGASLRA